MATSPLEQVSVCPCCGSGDLAERSILQSPLIAEWRLAPHEAAYIDRQQGFHCRDCGTNLRGMALAVAVMRAFAHEGTFRAFIADARMQHLRILEINEAEHLTRYLVHLPGHVLVRYPGVDMMELPFEDKSFDLVVHSDTLEHIAHPIRGLSECRRVLKLGGVCAFTVPMIVERLTRSRAGLPPSYHGSPGQQPDDHMVQTEYGGDAWKQVILAGFEECRIHALEHPSAHALVGVRRA
jgi:SAM-dependent methyltransferase